MIVKEERGRNKESDRKEEISSTEFPEGRDAIYTEDPPASHGGSHQDTKMPSH